MSIIVTVSGLNQNYLNALEKVALTATESYDALSDGLLLAGGGDVSPCAYSQVNESSFNVDLERDQREFLLLRKFIKAKKPVLGICRGLQVINVFFGGSLFQDVKNHTQIHDIDRKISITAKQSSFIERLYEDTLTVNCAHHQAVSKLGKGLRVSAVSQDGIIEAIEGKALPVIATQFHPERMGECGLKIFEYFKNLIKNSNEGLR